MASNRPRLTGTANARAVINQKQMENRIVKKVILIILLILIIIFVFQITFAKSLSFSNDNVDHFFHFTQNTIIISIVSIILLFLFINSKRTGHRIVIGMVSLPVILLFIVSVIFSIGIVFKNDSTNVRYYFFNKDGYSYYVVSERFYAFEGSSNLQYYKEKPLVFFIKQRVYVSEEELNDLGIRISEVNKIFLKKYFKDY